MFYRGVKKITKQSQINIFKSVDKKFKLGTQFIPVSRDEELKSMFSNILNEALKLNFRTEAGLEKVINDYVKMTFDKSIFNFQTLTDLPTKKKNLALKDYKNKDFEIVKMNSKFTTSKLKKISEKTIKNEANKTLSVFNSFYADIKKYNELGTLNENKASLEERVK